MCQTRTEIFSFKNVSFHYYYKTTNCHFSHFQVKRHYPNIFKLEKILINFLKLNVVSLKSSLYYPFIITLLEYYKLFFYHMY